MKKIPTLNEAKRSYDAIVKAGGMVDALPPVEQIILKFSPTSPFQYWKFRRELRAVLSGAMKTPESEKKADTFLNKYLNGKPYRQFANLLLRAIKEANEEEE
jgi:hypothetical protein